MERKRPEIVSPAGDWGSLRSAANAGADAVYFGVKGINMRHAASNFDVLEIAKVMNFLHEKGIKGYLALNVLVYNKELDKIKKILSAAKKGRVDAVILWDMAVFSYAREMGLKVHLSTQASVSNVEALRFYCEQGAERIVLARECSLSDMKSIMKQIEKEKINCSIETFVHGAMCVAISGRCFLSQQSFFKSANRGECLQPCRREYLVSDLGGESQYVMGRDYILSSKDLCAIDFLDKLIEAGIGAFKIEGRMRAPEYVSIVTSVYKDAVNAFYDGKLDDKAKKNFSKKLKGVFNRGFTSGFYFGVPNGLGKAERQKYDKIYIGEIKKYYAKIRVAEITASGGEMKVGQKLLISGKKTPASFMVIDEIQIDHKPVNIVKKGNVAGVRMPFAGHRGDKVFLWKERP
ncbi:MAG: peptidase U32 family protein [Candidatus Omnitrophota bacterium]